jgi:hypothetical protein
VTRGTAEFSRYRSDGPILLVPEHNLEISPAPSLSLANQLQQGITPSGMGLTHHLADQQFAALDD